MILLQTIAQLREWRRSVRQNRVVLVPTMGALHHGHQELVRAARRIAGPDGLVVATVFVNPLQFGPAEDFGRYPRELEADCEKCAAAGADLVFAPAVEEVYAPDRSIIILEQSLSSLLCGASRPGHFDGVCTVVTKLFNLVQPHDSIFGQKDYQQLAIIRRMVRDLNVPVHIIGIPTVREPDGLAMSSRNRYLTAEERQQAPALHAALQRAQRQFSKGETSASALRQSVLTTLAETAPLARLDYAEIVQAETLQPLTELGTEPAVIALAAIFGKTRLIDNHELKR
jgi:pantoate--beta-alanine ligase